MLKIEILCPDKKCRKCQRFVRAFENLIDENIIDAEIQLITSLDEMLHYRTWIIPSVFVNGKVFLRGYVPSKRILINKLKQIE